MEKFRHLPGMKFLFKQPHEIQLTHLRETVDVMARRITSQEGYIMELEGRSGRLEREVNHLKETLFHQKQSPFPPTTVQKPSPKGMFIPRTPPSQTKPVVQPLKRKFPPAGPSKPVQTPKVPTVQPASKKFKVPQGMKLVPAQETEEEDIEMM